MHDDQRCELVIEADGARLGVHPFTAIHRPPEPTAVWLIEPNGPAGYFAPARTSASAGSEGSASDHSSVSVA